LGIAILPNLCAVNEEGGGGKKEKKKNEGYGKGEKECNHDSLLY
jgi:hypothetical protein